MGRHGIARPGKHGPAPKPRSRPVRYQSDVHEITVAGARVLRVGLWRDEEERPTLVILASSWTDRGLAGILTDRAVTFPVELVGQVREALAALEETLTRPQVES